MSGSRHTRITLLLTSLVVVALLVAWLALGIPPLDPSSTADTSPSTPESGSEPSQVATILLYPDGSQLDDYNGSEPLTIETGIQIKARGHPPVHYENARLCFYNQNGTRLGNANLGPIVSPESGEVLDYYTRNVTVNERPEYIIVDHPKLRNNSFFRTQIRYWDEDQQWLGIQYGTLDEVQDSFEWPRTGEVGKCG